MIGKCEKVRLIIENEIDAVQKFNKAQIEENDFKSELGSIESAALEFIDNNILEL